MRRLLICIVIVLLTTAVVFGIPVVRNLQASPAERSLYKAAQYMDQNPEESIVYLDPDDYNQLIAQDDLLDAVESDPNYALGWLYLGTTYIYDGYYSKPEAYKDIKKAIKLFKKKDFHMADCYFFMGRAYMADEKYEQALKWFQKALDTYTEKPQDATIYYYISACYDKMHLEDKQMHALKKSISLYPSKIAYYDIGAIYEYDWNDIENALKYYYKAIENDNGNFWDTRQAYLSISFYYKEKGDTKKAEQIIDDMDLAERAYNKITFTSIIEKMKTDPFMSFEAFWVVTSIYLGVFLVLIFMFIEKKIREKQFKIKKKKDYEPIENLNYQVLEDKLRTMEKSRIMQNLFLIFSCVVLPVLTLIIFIKILPKAEQYFEGWIMLECATVLLSNFVVARRKKFKIRYKEIMVRSVISALNMDATYSPEVGFKTNEIFNTRIFHNNSTNIPGNFVMMSDDMIEGKYNYIHFRCADLRGRQLNKKVIMDFTGRFLSFDYKQKKIDGLYVYQKWQGRTPVFSIKKVETDDSSFNKNFDVYCDDREQALYVLTPHFMESILRLERKTSGPMIMYFTKGIIYVAIDNKKNNLEPHMWRKITAKEYAPEVFDDIIAITDFIDELKLRSEM